MKYEDLIAMPLEQQQDWYRNLKKDTQRLGEEITQFLKYLHDNNNPHKYREYNGLWNCHAWLLPTLDKKGIAFKGMQANAHQAETVTFEVNNATLTIAEYDVSLHTMHFEDTADSVEEDDDPHFLGTVLELNLVGNTPSTNFQLGLRWFAYDNEEAGKGMNLDDFHQRCWAFPAPVWCHMLGNNDDARDWLTLTKLSI